MLPSTTYSRARRNLKSVFDRVCRDHEPVVITRRSGGSVVVLSEEDYASLEETAYLLRSPANARRLLDAVARDRAGVPGKPLEEVLEALELPSEARDDD